MPHDHWSLVLFLKDWTPKRVIQFKFRWSNSKIISSLKMLRKDGYVDRARVKVPWSNRFVEHYRTSGKYEREVGVKAFN